MNKVTAILRFSEKQYYTPTLEIYCDDIKQTWKVLNNVIKKKNSVSNIPSEFITDKTYYPDRKDIVNGFNEFFVNIGPDLAKNIPVHVTNYMNIQNDKSKFLIPADESKVITIVRNCSKKSSEDSHNVSMKLLKEIFQYIVETFTYICNLSFKNGIFPDRMKMAKIVSLF